MKLISKERSVLEGAKRMPKKLCELNSEHKPIYKGLNSLFVLSIVR